MGTNYLGPFLLTMLLLPNLRQTAKKVAGLIPDPDQCFCVCMCTFHSQRREIRAKQAKTGRDLVYVQNNLNKPVRIVNVSSKMHELAPGVDKDDPHFQAQRSYSSLAAYNRSKLAQVDRIDLLPASLPPSKDLTGDCKISAIEDSLLRLHSNALKGSGPACQSYEMPFRLWVHAELSASGLFPTDLRLIRCISMINALANFYAIGAY